MDIVLTAVDAPPAVAWAATCGDLPVMSVHRGSILDVRCDAVVHPANRFRFTDGGIDYLYSRRFGWGAQQWLQAVIRQHRHGELLVGQGEAI